MNEPKNPFDLLLDQFRVIVREEVERALAKKQPVKLQYTLEEAAIRLNVKPSLLSAKIKGDPPLPHHRMGRRIYFTEQDLIVIDELTANGTDNGKN